MNFRLGPRDLRAVRTWYLLPGYTLVLLVAALLAPPCRAATPVQAGNSFAPLERWKAAVLAGDQTTLKSLYSADADAYVETVAGKKPDAATEEPQFWLGLHAKGITGLEPKILERSTPDSATLRLVLRLEMTFRQNNETQRSVVGAAQIWVNRRGSWRILGTQRSDAASLHAFRLPQPAIPNTSLYPDPGEAHKELNEALAAARKDHKRVLVVFGANWCYDCHVLDAALHSKELAPLAAANYHIVHVSIGDDGKSNADLAARFEVPLDKGVPSLAVLDGNERLVTSQRNGEFESAAKIGMEDVSGFLNRWKPEGTH